MNAVEHLLNRRIGLDASRAGPRAIERAVRTRMRANGCMGREDYLALLLRSKNEWDNLVESILVSETWFFRDEDAFAALKQHVMEEWLPTHARSGLRILSLPCATGEEPASIVMTLLDAKFPANRLRVDAIDLSAKAIAFALKGVYGGRSFRGKGPALKPRYFESQGHSHQLSHEVRGMIRFIQGNPLDKGILEEEGAYDFIFCRNLLIYFDHPAQQRLLGKLRQSLTANGTLFLGRAEMALALSAGFASTGAPNEFACRRQVRTRNSITRRLPHVSLNKSRSLASRDGLSRAAHRPHSAGSQSIQPPSRGARMLQNLDDARLLIDQGNFTRAVQVCEDHLRAAGASAHAYCLLGMAWERQGDKSLAGEHYRRALYLDPEHEEALRQWATLLERAGENNRAKNLQRRMERLTAETAG